VEAVTILAALLALAVAARTYRVREQRLDARVERLEARIYRLTHHLGLSDPSAELEEARRLAAGGNKQRAIAEYRKVTGAGPEDAAKAVEGMAKAAQKK
jgi:ribosomal protein L7/L12